ncbi:hypothetical protein SAMN05421504_102174 [Amycolatopsis xylanica]|uniref:Uncharacterized protein n=1 Tax=Amycolatopsis xylanica TaxID=589385 RepID=A0A1H2YL41_9PSEU|nr:hypothetical protein [Amycolatopsis xylanica]SDX05886.1 hypothetical protein SAMN05421504_102174 [Amycolatopsis xylanica]
MTVDFDSLDKSFLEAGGLVPFLVPLAGWVDFLTNKHDSFSMEGQSQMMQGLPMTDVHFDDFFHTAQLLSGQPLDELGQVYETLVKNARGLDDGMEDFQSACVNIFRNWRGDAQAACAAYGGKIMDFVNDEREAAATLASCLLSYASIIKAARADWLKLAQNFVAALGQKQENDEASGWKVVLTVVGSLVGAAFGVVTAGVGLAASEAAVATAISYGSAVTAAVADGVTEAAKESLDGEKYQDIAYKYLRACRELEERLVNGINDEVLPKLQQLGESRPTPPSSPVDVGRFDEDPGKVLVPEHTTDDVDKWLAKKKKEAGSRPPSNISSALG